MNSIRPLEPAEPVDPAESREPASPICQWTRVARAAQPAISTCAAAYFVLYVWEVAHLWKLPPGGKVAADSLAVSVVDALGLLGWALVAVFAVAQLVSRPSSRARVQEAPQYACALGSSLFVFGHALYVHLRLWTGELEASSFGSQWRFEVGFPLVFALYAVGVSVMAAHTYFALRNLLNASGARVWVSAIAASAVWAYGANQLLAIGTGAALFF